MMPLLSESPMTLQILFAHNTCIIESVVALSM